MNFYQTPANRWASRVASLSLFLLIGAGTGCAHHPRHMPKGLCTPSCPPCYCAESLFYGHHGTCWQPWPEGWVHCPYQLTTEEVGPPAVMMEEEPPAPEPPERPSPARTRPPVENAPPLDPATLPQSSSRPSTRSTLQPATVLEPLRGMSPFSILDKIASAEQ
jgi:hypothetical protein